MCRISFIAKPESLRNPKLLMDHMMLQSFTDDNQKDGCGVSDGKYAVKSFQPYPEVGIEMLDRLDVGRSWIGHVRRRSNGTDYNAEAAHPYRYFPVPDVRMTFVHNGFVELAGYETTDPDEPNTDSYRAGKVLSQMIGKNQGQVNLDIIRNWLDGMYAFSEFAFAFQLDDKAYIVRGNREINMLQVNGSYIGNTSAKVLDRVRVWMRSQKLYAVDKGSYFLPPFTFATFSAGKMVDMQEFKWNPVKIKSKPSQVTYD